MSLGGPFPVPAIAECIQDAKEYDGLAQRVMKRARLDVEVASNHVQNSRLEALASVAEKFPFLQSHLEDIIKGLKKKIALDTSIQDLCHAIVKIAAYLADVAQLLFLVQEYRKMEFYAEGAVGLVKRHFTEKRTIQLMQKENKEMIKTLHQKWKGSAADDPSDNNTQLDDCEATGDNLATTYGQLQHAIEKGLKLDMDATQHVLAWEIQAVEEVNGYMAKHNLSLYPLVEDMFIKAVDERDDRIWIHDLKEDLNNIACRSIRVEKVMEMVSTLQKACGDGQQEESQVCSPAESQD